MSVEIKALMNPDKLICKLYFEILCDTVHELDRGKVINSITKEK